MAHKVALKRSEQEVERIKKPQASNSKSRKLYALGSAFVAVLLLGVSLGVMISADTPSGFPTVIEPGSMVSESILIFQDGGKTFVKNGTTGALMYSSTSSYSAIQYAINSVQGRGGTIYLKQGTYVISNTLNITKSNVTIDADQGTVISSSIMPVLTVWGGSWYDDWLVYNSTNGIRISNLEFRYTGPVATGKFIYIHKVTPGLIYIPGFLILNNLLIRSTQVAIPTNLNFVGLQIEDICSARFNAISIAFFGTGLKISTNPMPNKGNEMYNNDGMKFERLQVCLCSVGVYIEGITYTLVFDHLKMMYNALYGVTSSGTAAKNIFFNSPFFEGFSQFHSYWPHLPQKAINATGEYVTVINGVFNGIAGYGIYRAGNSLTVIDSVFNWVEDCIYLYESSATLIGNRYYNEQTMLTHDGVCFVRTFNDELVLETRGLAWITGTNYVIVQHGMSASAILVVCSFNSTAYGSYSIAVNDASTFNIYVQNPGYYTVYWYAQAVVP